MQIERREARNADAAAGVHAASGVGEISGPAMGICQRPGSGHEKADDARGEKRSYKTADGSRQEDRKRNAFGWTGKIRRGYAEESAGILPEQRLHGLSANHHSYRGSRR